MEGSDSSNSLSVDWYHCNGVLSLSFLIESQESNFRHAGEGRDFFIEHAPSLQGDKVNRMTWHGSRWPGWEF